jgi:hypothetical protein
MNIFAAIEALADLEHDRWARWQRYLHSQCERNEDGSLTIPAESVKHWERQITSKYTDLTDREKNSDRKEACRTIAVVLGLEE